MCNLFSETKGQDATRAIAMAKIDCAGNLPPFTGIFLDYKAPIVRILPLDVSLS